MAMNAEVDRACEAAANACDMRHYLGQKTWADMLDGIATDLGVRRDEILAVASEETALTIEELKPEFARMTGTFRMFAEVVRDGSWVRAATSPALHDPTRSIGPNHDVRSMLMPLGPVAVFGASNFPLAYGVCGGDTASALAAGCPVVVKEHPAHPRTGRLIYEVASATTWRWIAERFVGPLAIIGYVKNEDPRDLTIAQSLVQHPEIRAVGFTGSQSGGMALDKLARERSCPIPVFAEMGSVNPVFVTAKAAAARGVAIANELADSILARHGQQCTRPGLVFTEDRASTQRLQPTLVSRFASAGARDMLAPWVASSYRKRIEACAQTEGVSILSRGKDGSGERATAPVLMHTDLATWKRHPAVHTEIFGPAAILIDGFPGRYKMPDPLKAPIEHEAHLVASFHFEAEDIQAVQRYLRTYDLAGRLVFNGVPTGVRVAPGMVHGGPFPSTNRPDTTAVGPLAIERWCRPVCFQNCPQDLLPPELRDVEQK